MLFNSYTFLIFFAAVVFLTRLGLSWPTRKGILLGASYLFYAAWNPPFVVLLLISTLLDWFVGKALAQTRSLAGRRALLAASLICNLGLLGFFKYSGFLAENFVLAAGALGWDLHLVEWSIILPVGISFYTFQTLSYTLDIYRGVLRPWNSFLDYALYVTFFPQLVAGPIVRASHFLPQCSTPRRADAGQMGWGLALMAIGLFEKVVVADGLMARIVQQVYDGEAIPSLVSAWCGTVAFSVQIFCDFSGYSNCAIGAAMCLGFALPDNFRFPYCSVGFSEFWRRWHISLSTWMRDYLYVSLGGSRKGPGRAVINVIITMFLGGLWHGAAWQMVCWGLLHGAYLAGEHVLRTVIPGGRFWRLLPVRLVLGLLTFAMTNVAWVFFRAKTLARAWTVLRSMLAGSPGADALHLGGFELTMATTVTAVLLAAHWLLRDRGLEATLARVPWVIRSAALAAMVCLTLIAMTGEDRAFIYFQF